jgi:PAS domain S-box-containing protein
MTSPATPPAPGPTGPAADRPDSTPWRAALALAGGLLVLVGALALLAWAAGEPDYIQIDSARPPLHYNGALGFVAWGCAYLALAAGRFRAARLGAAGLIGLGLFTLAASVPGVGVRLDRWAFVPPPSCPPFPRGGAAPGLSLALCLAGLAVFLAARRSVTSGGTLVGTLVGLTLVIGGAVTTVSPHAGNVLVWPAGPSVLGVVGVGVAGLALLTSVFRKGVPAFALGRALPVSVGLAGIVFTFALWVSLNAEQTRRIHRQVQFEAAHVQRMAQDRLLEHVIVLTGLAERWGHTNPDQVKADVGNYVGRNPGCLGVARIDGSRTVTWVESSQNPPPPTALAELGLADALTAAVRDGRTTLVRPPRSNWRGTRVLVIYVPHRQNAPDSGGLISVVRVQDLFNTILNANVAPGYAIAVTENDGALFERYSSDRESRDRWGQTLPLNFRGFELRPFEWRLSVWPTRDVLERESLSLPKLALLIGFLTTSLLALAVHLAQTARRRADALETEARGRELAQRALAQSEEKYRTLIENLGQGIFLQDREYRYVAANVQFCRSVGRTEAEIVGATDAELFDPQRAAKHVEEVRTVLAEGKSVECEEEGVAGGRRTYIRRVLTPVRDASGKTTGVLGICWDVTEQRQLEAHVHQASKMDAIGQLAGGIAHDFNNLLTVILGNLELMLSRLKAPDRNRELAVAAQNAAARAASLTQRLLGFSRRHQLDWVPTNLNAVIDEVVAMLRRTIDPLIRIETRYDPDLWPIQADPAQLNQVLMNLCLNARDAITGAGQITIETSRVGGPELHEAGRNPRAGEFVRLRVADSGCGMTEEVRARMYEPFFTTKEVGKGTGLGLPMVFGIVRQHKGWIECRSEVGRGTCFDIYLPRGEASRAAAAGPAAPELRRGGKETILVVDDEEMIRQLASAALRGLGYTVLQAADGQEAIDLYSREGDRIDLVLLDLTMPVISGHEAFRHLLKLDPRVRVLFASGYAVDQLSDLEKELMAGFVKKPYRPNDLIRSVEEALPKRGHSKSDGADVSPLPPSDSEFNNPAVIA